MDNVSDALQDFLRRAHFNGRPDATALRKLHELQQQWNPAVRYVIQELRINLGLDNGGRGRQPVEFDITGEHDEHDHAVWRLTVPAAHRECKLPQQGSSELSKAIMSIAKRWQERLSNLQNRLLMEQPTDAIGPGLEPRRRKLQAGEVPTGKHPPPSPSLGPGGAGLSPNRKSLNYIRNVRRHAVKPGWQVFRDDELGLTYYRNEQQKQLVWEDERGGGAPHEAQANVHFEIKFRLEAAGWPWEKVVEHPAFMDKVCRLQKLYDACGGGNARQLNKECRALELPCRFESPAEETNELVFEVEVSRGRGPRPLAVHADGNAHAHRLLSRNSPGERSLDCGRLLRVRLPQPNGQDLRDEHARAQHRNWMKEVLVNGLHVCGRHFMYLDHKDADKPGRQLWFVAVSEQSLRKHRDNGMRSANLQREKLLDVFAKDLKVPKLAARLGLGFSPALPLCLLPTTRARFNQPWKCIDLRTSAGCANPTRYVREISEGRLSGSSDLVTLVLVDDMPAREVLSGEPARDPATGKVRVMTDGDGLIAADLARLVPPARSGRACTAARPARSGGGGGGKGAPVWMQVRLWWEGFVAKGGLSLDATLPDGVIILRDSQIKVNTRDGYRTRTQTLADGTKVVHTRAKAFELLRTSNPPGGGRLSPQLVPLLEHGGGELMTRLLLQVQHEQQQQILELRDADGNSDDALLRRLVRELGMRPSVEGAAVTAADMIMAGFEPSKEPYLKQKVADMVKRNLEDLACGKLRIEGSVNLPGRPDQTGTLAEGTVCVLQNGTFFEDDVLVYRNPGVAAGDLRRAKAVSPTPELARTLVGADPMLAHCVIFSTQGSRSMADMLSGGDYDGDEFLIMRAAIKVHLPLESVTLPYRVDLPAGRDLPAEEARAGPEGSPGAVAISIVEAFAHESPPYDPPAPPPGAPPPPKPPDVPTDTTELGKALVDHCLERMGAASTVGRAANLIAVAQEHWGCGDARVNRLIAAYYAALDAGKSGDSGDIPLDLVRELEALGYPAHLKGKARPGTKLLDEAESDSCLGRMYRARYGVQFDAPSEVSLDENLHLPTEAMLLQQNHNLYLKWKRHVQEYAKEVGDLIQKLGTAAGGQDGDDGMGSEEKSAKFAKELRALVRHFREQLLEPYSMGARELNAMREARPGEIRELLTEVCMLIKAVYDRAFDRQRGQDALSAPSCLGFAWNVAGDYLCHIKTSAIAAEVHTGRPTKAVSEARLCALVSSRGQGRATSSAATPADVEEPKDEVSVDELSQCAAT